MKSLRNLIAAAAAAVLVAVPTLAKADKLEDVLSAGKLRVGLLLDAAPWGFKDAKGEAAGLDVDLAKLMASDMGVKLEIVPLTGASRIPSLLAGKVDVLVAAMGATPERAQQVMFSQPYAAVNLGVFGPKSLPVTKNPADLKGRSIAVAKGSTLDVWLTDNAKDTKLVRFEDTPSAIAAYLSGQAETFAENSAIALKVAEDNAGKEVELKFLIRQSPAHVGVAQGEQNLLNWVNTFLFYNRLNGKLGELQLKHFKEAQTLPQM
ncbi:transporter substrate-binding domain-containing protein [Microvirga mediterraneensis]|uniref:Transporter substrate-binding domain-containing protein n=1 Tax=Microvirga mediterraneensis TaxID=2754695 RepID=A0A838BI00_9HYPH|nr:transporter substrate-binding domain-containing protein [Microvirga mediterraneensis]MBA1154593.1 transporter substrate-binding domain-containing protein [Microvirga mediterraneensis]